MENIISIIILAVIFNQLIIFKKNLLDIINILCQQKLLLGILMELKHN